MSRFPLRHQKGFTLVELLVVIAIIGILATLLLLQLGTARSRARDAKRIADVNQIRSAIELYFDDNGIYPPNITSTELGSYLTQVPVDPLPPTLVYGYITRDATRLQYHIWTELEVRAVGAMQADADIDSSTWTGPGSLRTGGSTANGVTETCANTILTDRECVYDQGQR